VPVVMPAPLHLGLLLDRLPSRLEGGYVSFRI
jgi:hypothetical protein